MTQDRTEMGGEQAAVTAEELEKRLSAELVKLGRINRDLRRDRIVREKGRLIKERSEINMLLLLHEAREREEGQGEDSLAPGEIQELIRDRGGENGLDGREIDRLRARRREIGTMLREIEHLPEEQRELPQHTLQQLVRERGDLQKRALEILDDPMYFQKRMRKIEKAVRAGKHEKLLRYLKNLDEQLGPTLAARCFDALRRLWRGTEDAIPQEELLGLIKGCRMGPFLQGVLGLTEQLKERYPGEPGGWREVIAATLSNVSLFRGVGPEGRSSFWESDDFRDDVEWKRRAVQNPSAPADLLSSLLGCPKDELERARERARRNYGSERAIDCMTEVLRQARDPELVDRILNVLDGDPILRYRMYRVARSLSDLPAPLGRRILSQGDFSLEESLEFRARNPTVDRRD